MTTAAPTVGITADRRWQEQADLFRRLGVDVLHGPTMRTVDLADDQGLRAVTEALVVHPPDWLVATTGMGMRWWLEAAGGWGLREALLDALGRARVVARGAKSTSAVRQAGLEVAWRAPGESMAEVVEYLRTHAGGTSPRVAIQLFDPDDHPTTDALRAVAGELVEVPLYRWLLPADPAPAQRLVEAAIAGRLGAVTFTSQPAVRFLFELAGARGQAGELRDAFNRGGVLAACIGPVCAQATEEVGIENTVWPEPFRLPPMVRLVAEHLVGEALQR